MNVSSYACQPEEDLHTAIDLQALKAGNDLPLSLHYSWQHSVPLVETLLAEVDVPLPLRLVHKTFNYTGAEGPALRL